MFVMMPVSVHVFLCRPICIFRRSSGINTIFFFSADSIRECYFFIIPVKSSLPHRKSLFVANVENFVAFIIC